MNLRKIEYDSNFWGQKSIIYQYMPLLTHSCLSLLVFSSSCLPVPAQELDSNLLVPSFPESNLAPNTLPTTTEYILGASDRIYLDVFQVPELSREYLIVVDGTVSFPWIGRIKLAGLTLTEATQVLSQAYAAYLKRSIVTVTLLTPRPLKIAIAGEVNIPGSYNISLAPGERSPSVTDILKQAGGTTTTADISQVELLRTVDGKERIYTLNLWQILQQGNLNQDITLEDGDRIFIPTKSKIDPAETRLLSNANFGIQTNQEIDVVVAGEVYRPGSYKIEPERALSRNDRNLPIRKPPRLSQAIQIAGGIKPLADIRSIEVRRFQYDGSQQTIQVNLWELLQNGDLAQDVILQDGDTILIPKAEKLDPQESETFASANFAPDSIRVNVVGEVKKPGGIDLPPNTPLNQAILAAGGFDKRRAKEKTVELIRLNPNGTVSKRDIPVDFTKDANEENNPLLRNNDVVVINRSRFTATTDTLDSILRPVASLLGVFGLIEVLFR